MVSPHGRKVEGGRVVAGLTGLGAVRVACCRTLGFLGKPIQSLLYVAGDSKPMS